MQAKQNGLYRDLKPEIDSNKKETYQHKSLCIEQNNIKQYKNLKKNISENQCHYAQLSEGFLTSPIL